jgi:hypothetical protein
LSPWLGSHIIAIAVIIINTIIIIIIIIIHHHHHHHHHFFHQFAGIGSSQRTVVMLPSAGPAGFKAVVPGHGAADSDAPDKAIDIIDTLDRRHEEQEHF